MQERSNRESSGGRSTESKGGGIIVANETVVDYASLHTEDRREREEGREGAGGGGGGDLSV